MSAIAQTDLVVECLADHTPPFDLLQCLGTIMRSEAILVTTDTILAVDEIAAATSRPENVIGLRMFPTAERPSLVEIARGTATAPAVLATVSEIVRRAGLIGVTLKGTSGSVVQRLLGARDKAAEQMLLEGVAISAIDQALKAFGFSSGHFEMLDRVGLDRVVCASGNDASDARALLIKEGRLGQRIGAGYYDYDDELRATPSPDVARILALRGECIAITSQTVSETDISERLVFAMINEAARISEERIMSRPSDIDVICVHAFGWPRYRGGPVFWLDHLGAEFVHQRLQILRDKHGRAFDPAAFIRGLADGKSVAL